jgi:hypothetical protein
MGAVEGLRAALGLPGPYGWRRPRERMAEAVRPALGEEAFAAAWAEARAMSPEQAIGYALEEPGDAPPKE